MYGMIRVVLASDKGGMVISILYLKQHEIGARSTPYLSRNRDSIVRGRFYYTSVFVNYPRTFFKR